MHISLLMTILSMLFFTAIMPAERGALQHEIKNGLSTFLTPLLAPGSPFTLLLNNIPTNLLKQSLDGFNTPDFYISDMNERLVAQAVTMCVILVLMFVGSYIALRFSCGFCPEIVSLILENLCTFAFVGIIEYLFFTRVALHFVPTLPSFFVTNILEETKSLLISFQPKT
jgi:hypothetical protein